MEGNQWLPPMEGWKRMSKRTRAEPGKDVEGAIRKVVKELNAWLPKLITAAAMPHG